MKRKNIISAVLSLTMLVSTFTGLTVNAENNTSAASKYSSTVMVYDDEYFDAASQYYGRLQYDGQTAIATHASGAKWLMSNVYVMDYKLHKAKFDNRIYAWGVGESWTNVYLYLDENIEIFEKTGNGCRRQKPCYGHVLF